MIFLKNGKNHLKCKNSKTSRNMPKLAIYPFYQRSLIHREAWFPPCFVRQNQPKKNGDFRPFPNKNVEIWEHFFPLLFPKDSESLKIMDIQLWEVGAKRRLNGTSKVNTRTNRRTDRRTNRLIERIGPEGRCFEKRQCGSTSCLEINKSHHRTKITLKYRNWAGHDCTLWVWKVGWKVLSVSNVIRGKLFIRLLDQHRAGEWGHE